MLERLIVRVRLLARRWGVDLGRTRDETAASITECSCAHDVNRYFTIAEPEMEREWRDYIWPRIADSDFRSVLELAPGHGRNTAKLLDHAGEIFLVDVNASCIEACRQRFGDDRRLHYHINDGASLGMIRSGSVTLVYSWDAVVHFDKEIVRRYV